MTKRKTHEDFVKQVDELFDGEFEVLERYINNNTKIKIRHNICGCIINVRPDHFLRLEIGCKTCKKEEIKRLKSKTTSEFKQEVKQLVGDDYSVLSDYNGSQIKIKMKHNICGYQWDIIPNSFLRGVRCPNCNKNVKNKTTEFFKKEIESIVDDEYTVIGDYKDAKTKIKIKHNPCNHIWDVTPDNFLRGKRCPQCNQSKGEHLINKILTDNNINFIRQFRFNDCRNKQCLPFDFAIFKNGNLFCLIEYHGEQHYKPIDFFGGEKSYIYRKQNDKIKLDYCISNNINLIIIPYNKFNNIEKILLNL